MTGRFAYLDASALVKLAVNEPETPALRRFLVDWPDRSSSALVRTEVRRAVRRLDISHMGAIETLLRRIHLVAVEDEILDDAGGLEPQMVRSLDAIHLATARALGADMGVLVSYDQRMSDGAGLLGLRCASPA